ncbi:MAG TPA: NAD(P)H-binding protein [Chitinispirillaceae bacterium]|nr:NAD(P)H-binding protein [Chitinispirillaceae bacterium]
MAESILVAGANGTIGKELVKKLLEYGSCIRIGVRNLEKAAAINYSNCPVVIFDYEKPETFKNAFEGISKFFLATPSGHPQIDQLILPVIEAAKSAGVDHLVTLGALGVEQDNSTPLSIAEKCVQQCGIDYTILRPNLFMQNILNLSDSIKKYKELRLPGGYAHISFVDARDVAAAAASILLHSTNRNHIYLLTGKESPDLFEVARCLSIVCGKTISYIPVSHSEAYQEFLSCGLSSQNANLINGLFEIARQGWCEKIRPDLKEILKHDPISFQQFAWDYQESWSE